MTRVTFPGWTKRLAKAKQFSSESLQYSASAAVIALGAQLCSDSSHFPATISRLVLVLMSLLQGIGEAVSNP